LDWRNAVGDWFYRPDFVYRARALILYMLEIVSRDGDYAVNISLKPDGALDQGSRQMLGNPSLRSHWRWIVWAIIDSGVDAKHIHSGRCDGNGPNIFFVLCPTECRQIASRFHCTRSVPQPENFEESRRLR